MSEEIEINDINQLEELNSLFTSTAENMSAIDCKVSTHLSAVKFSLVKKLGKIKNKHEEAEKELKKAEEDLKKCEEAQNNNDDSGENKPSCICENLAYREAKQKEKEWNEKLEKAKSIMDNCKETINNYQTSNSGHGLISNMCDNATPAITKQLQKFIDELNEYNGENVGGKNDTTIAIFKKAVGSGDGADANQRSMSGAQNGSSNTSQKIDQRVVQQFLNNYQRGSR